MEKEGEKRKKKTSEDNVAQLKLATISSLSQKGKKKKKVKIGGRVFCMHFGTTGSFFHALAI